VPNRILKESICSSDTVDKLSWFEEVLFYRLIVSCDDFGRFDGRPAIIKNRLFPLKENLTLKAVSAAIKTLASAGLVALYEFEGKPYLYLPTWNEHQNVRAKRSKYPEPNVNTSDCNCMHMNADVPDIRIQSESVSESESECESSADKPPARTRFHAPDVEAVRAYCQDQGYTHVSPERFVDYYTANGWKVGKNPMEDWKAAVRGWESREKQMPGYGKKDIPKGASGELGEAELEAIHRLFREDMP